MQSAFTAIGSFFTSLLAKITGFASWVLEVVTQLFLDVWAMLQDLIIWVFDVFMELAVSAIGALPSVPGIGSIWSGAPGEILNILGLIGFGQALAIIGAALLVRMGLQLIPFTRLGS